MTVTRGPVEPGLEHLVSALSVSSAEDGIVAALRVLRRSGALSLPLPGRGETAHRFRMLRTFGEYDLCLARLAEGHTDGIAILDEAGIAAPEGLLGVWAAGPIATLKASRSPAGGWRLDGVRRWCSGAPSLDYALITAAASDGDRLFLVPLTSRGVHPRSGSWPAIGMARTETLDVDFDGVDLLPSAAVGAPGFYLDRRGFWFGGAGVAAVWLGGATAVASVLKKRAGTDPHRLAHLGWITARISAVDALNDVVAAAIDDEDSGALLIETLAHSVRAEAADAAAEIIDRTGRATGAGPLAHDATHAQRVADLSVYIRQSHAEADLEHLGRLALRAAGARPD